MQHSETPALPNILLAETTQPTDNFTQHGVLNSLPTECLTHISSFVEPIGLLLLARASKRLYLHVKDDNTWHRAFLCQYMGISPADALEDAKPLTLRRSDPSSWRNEFLSRYKHIRRWEMSRSAVIAHFPFHSAKISGMHLMQENALLTSSLQYGVVSRSVPLVGKNLRGSLDPSRSGMGAGNPNAGLAQDMSACELASDGGTARIVFGFRSGQVSTMTASKVMDPGGCAGAKLVPCNPQDAHFEQVNVISWDGTMFATASTGSVKYWDFRTARCVWTSPPSTAAVPDLYTNVVAVRGIVVAALHSRSIQIWTDLTTDCPRSIHVPKPIQLDENDEEQYSTLSLFLDAATSTILVAYVGHPFFYRVIFNLANGTTEATQFGREDALGAITILHPVFALQGNGHSFVLVGDQLGCLSMYDLTGSPLGAVRRVEAHEDGHISAIAWNATVIATGSTGGTMQVWDALTLAPLKTFIIKAPRTRRGEVANVEIIAQIALERDFIVALAGGQIVAWKAGPVPAKVKSKGLSRPSAHVKSKFKTGTAKYYEQVELKESLAESRKEREDHQRSLAHSHRRAREERTTLESLGLDETEALEYTLMLSRDEQEMRYGSSMMFEGDFDDIPRSPSLPPPRVSPSRSNEKVQVTLPFRAEPMRAGGGTSFVEPMSLSPEDPAHFPAMRSSPSKSKRPSTSPQKIQMPWWSPESSRWKKPLEPTPAVPWAPSRRASPTRRAEDDDLRLAIELSLIEARTQGLDV